jgi:O-acetylserine/cysteine efflux transporter
MHRRMNHPASNHPSRFGAFELLVVLLINLLFAVNLIAIKEVVEASAPFSASALRMTIVFLFCAPALRFVRGKTVLLAAYGAMNGGVFLLLLNMALNSADNVGALAIAGQLSVPFSLLLGVMVFGERLSPARLAGVALALLGVAVLGFDPAIAKELNGMLLMVLAAFVWALGALLQRRLMGVTVLNTQAWNGLMGAAVLIPFALWFEPGVVRQLPDMPTAAQGWLAFSCIGSTIIGQGAFAWLLQRHPIATVTPLMLLAPVLSAGIASFYFNTPIALAMIIGTAIALVGVAIIALTAPKSVPPPID